VVSFLAESVFGTPFAPTIAFVPQIVQRDNGSAHLHTAAGVIAITVAQVPPINAVLASAGVRVNSVEVYSAEPEAIGFSLPVLTPS